MGYDYGDPFLQTKTAAVQAARQQIALKSGTFAALRSGGDTQSLVNGHWDADGNWVERGAAGFLTFGPPGFTG